MKRLTKTCTWPHNDLGCSYVFRQNGTRHIIINLQCCRCGLFTIKIHSHIHYVALSCDCNNTIENSRINRMKFLHWSTQVHNTTIISWSAATIVAMVTPTTNCFRSRHWMPKWEDDIRRSLSFDRRILKLQLSVSWYTSRQVSLLRAIHQCRRPLPRGSRINSTSRFVALRTNK